MQKRAKTEGIGVGIPPNKIYYRIFAFSVTLVIFKQRFKHATPVGLYIMIRNTYSGPHMGTGGGRRGVPMAGTLVFTPLPRPKITPHPL